MNPLWKFYAYWIFIRLTRNLHLYFSQVEFQQCPSPNWSFKMSHCLKFDANYKNCFLICIALSTLYFRNAYSSNRQCVWLRSHGDHRILSKWIVYENSTPTEYLFYRRRILISLCFTVKLRGGKLQLVQTPIMKSEIS